MGSPSLRLVVDWVHIREAERRGRRVTPFGLALLEQSRYHAVDVSADGAILEDGLTGARERFVADLALTEFLRRFAAGEPVTPGVFLLEAG